MRLSVSDALPAMNFAAPTLPVKLIRLTSGLVSSSSPKSWGKPVSICIPSGGSPASSMSSPILRTVSGHCSGNFTITDAPAATAPGTLCAKSSAG